LFDEVISQEHWDEKRGEAILTTWHDKESVEEVVFQFVRLTFPEQSEPKVSLMLFPSKDKRAQDYIACLKEIERTSK